MTKTAARTLVALVASAVTLSAQALSQDRLERIDRYFQEEIAQQHLAGAVALVLREGKPVYDKAFGWADKEANRKMATDDIFRIASQSKALTSVVILSLMEAGWG
jgi:CubicO group peptidase (beta-lactamase class C family)